MSDWESPMCRFLHKPIQVLWFSSEEWFLLVMLYFGGLVADAILWLLIIPAVFSVIPAFRKKPRSFFKHFLLLLGIRQLKGYLPPISGRFYE